MILEFPFAFWKHFLFFEKFSTSCALSFASGETNNTGEIFLWMRLLLRTELESNLVFTFIARENHSS